MIELFQNTDWATLGTTVAAIVGTVIGGISWLKKNIANVQKLKEDGANVDEQIKYAKAMLKDNAGLRTEISNSKIQTRELTSTFTAILKKKDEEIDELKLLVKEAVNGIPKQN